MLHPAGSDNTKMDTSGMDYTPPQHDLEMGAPAQEDYAITHPRNNTAVKATTMGAIYGQLSRSKSIDSRTCGDVAEIVLPNSCHGPRHKDTGPECDSWM
jgi:hypothetical protein